MKKESIKLDAPLVRRIRKLARANGRTFSGELRVAVLEFLKKYDNGQMVIGG